MFELTLSTLLLSNILSVYRVLQCIELTVPHCSASACIRSLERLFGTKMLWHNILHEIQSHLWFMFPNMNNNLIVVIIHTHPCFFCLFTTIVSHKEHSNDPHDFCIGFSVLLKAEKKISQQKYNWCKRPLPIFPSFSVNHFSNVLEKHFRNHFNLFTEGGECFHLLVFTCEDRSMRQINLITYTGKTTSKGSEKESPKQSLHGNRTQMRVYFIISSFCGNKDLSHHSLFPFLTTASCSYRLPLTPGCWMKSLVERESLSWWRQSKHTAEWNRRL